MMSAIAETSASAAVRSRSAQTMPPMAHMIDLHPPLFTFQFVIAPQISPSHGFRFSDPVDRSARIIVIESRSRDSANADPDQRYIEILVVFFGVDQPVFQSDIQKPADHFYE